MAPDMCHPLPDGEKLAMQECCMWIFVFLLTPIYNLIWLPWNSCWWAQETAWAFRESDAFAGRTPPSNNPPNVHHLIGFCCCLVSGCAFWESKHIRNPQFCMISAASCRFGCPERTCLLVWQSCFCLHFDMFSVSPNCLPRFCALNAEFHWLCYYNAFVRINAVVFVIFQANVKLYKITNYPSVTLTR